MSSDADSRLLTSMKTRTTPLFNLSLDALLNMENIELQQCVPVLELSDGHSNYPSHGASHDLVLLVLLVFPAIFFTELT